MKTQNAFEARNARGLSDAVIEKRYLDLQRLRDAVRMAEINFVAMKLPGQRKAAAELVSSPKRARPSLGRQR